MAYESLVPARTLKRAEGGPCPEIGIAEHVGWVGVNLGKEWHQAGGFERRRWSDLSLIRAVDARLPRYLPRAVGCHWD